MPSGARPASGPPDQSTTQTKEPPLTEKKQQPTRRQGDALRAQRVHGDEARGWLLRQAHKLEKLAGKAAEKRARKKAKAAAKAAKKNPPPRRTVEWVHVHTRPSRAMRRVGGRNRWTGVKNTPYVNPARTERLRKSGRLRSELR
jgi:hypothetical protein